MKLKLFRQILQKYSNIKCHENTNNGSLLVLCEKDGQAKDRQDEANYRIPQFRERDQI